MIPGQIEPFVGPLNSKMTIGGNKTIASNLGVEASVETNQKKARSSRKQTLRVVCWVVFSKGHGLASFDLPRVARARTAEDPLSSTTTVVLSEHCTTYLPRLRLTGGTNELCEC